MKAVRFDHYGGIDVLEVRDVDDPKPEAGEVLVEVKAAGINPGEISIREGYLHERWPATFPSGEGTDFAGIVRTAGDGVHDVSAGDEVLGWTEQRASQAELVVAPADQVRLKPANLPWEVAGSLFVVGMAGCTPCRRSRRPPARRSWCPPRAAASGRSPRSSRAGPERP